jgi:hypothetical protein
VWDKCIADPEVVPCTITNGSGHMSTGVNNNECEAISCNPSYTLTGNACVLTNQERDCSVTNGSGLEYSTDA